MEKKFKRKETSQPLTDFGKPTKKNNRPELETQTLDKKEIAKK